MADGESTDTLDEREAQRKRMAEKRAEARNLHIPLPQSIDRRNRCLGDPVLFLQTYFAETFNQPFTEDRKAMLQSIIYAAEFGGDYAIAGPRGEGKTRLAIYGALYLMFADLSNFPVVIGKSQTKSQNELKTIKERLQQSEMLIADFPEVGVPFQEVGAWSSRARMQTVGGEHTNIVIASDHIIFPTIPRHCLHESWPDECEPVSKGQIMSSLGVDGPIRGTNYRDRRPTLAILDDIESKGSAESDTIIESNEDIIEKDIGGLGAGGRRVSRVMLCTTQNRKCIAYKYTDRTAKPSWNGRRFRKLVTEPTRMDLWDKYVELRINRDGESDPDARAAHVFYRDNKTSMDAGAHISNPYNYDTRKHNDGDSIELSALQAYFNRVADFGKEAVATEDDNDPPEEVGPQGSGITDALVRSRVNGLRHSQLPASTQCVTVGIDLGKYICHWVAVGWLNNGTGCICDYGVAEVLNTDSAMDSAAAEPAIYNALINWRSELQATEYVDASGARRNVDVVFVDSGAFTDAAYKFVNDVGGKPYFATKGIGNYREPTPKSNISIAHQAHASYLAGPKLWLYNLNVDYWKRYVHERFLTPTFDDNNQLRDGSLSLFQPEGSRKHISFSKHVVAEEWVSEFKQGKGERTFWTVHNRNNHWLDALTMATAAAGTLGVRVMQSQDKPKLAPQNVQRAKAMRKATSNRQPSRRAGGWVNGVRRNR